MPWPRLLGEFSIIVVGVLVALALEGWAEEQADRSLVESYLETLEAELVQDTSLNGIFVQLYERRVQAVRLLLADLNESTLGLSGADELIALNLAASPARPLYTTSMTEELLSTGNARLLDLPLLVAIQQVAARFQISRDEWESQLPSIRVRAPGLVPGYMRRALRDCYSSCTDEEWAFDDESVREMADSLLGTAPQAELTALQGWRSKAGLRESLEEESHFSGWHSGEPARGPRGDRQRT